MLSIIDVHKKRMTFLCKKNTPEMFGGADVFGKILSVEECEKCAVCHVDVDLGDDLEGSFLFCTGDQREG